MSARPPSTIWDAIISCAPGICIAICLMAFGGCCYLLNTSEAKLRAAEKTESK